MTDDDFVEHEYRPARRPRPRRAEALSRVTADGDARARSQVRVTPPPAPVEPVPPAPAGSNGRRTLGAIALVVVGALLGAAGAAFASTKLDSSKTAAPPTTTVATTTVPATTVAASVPPTTAATVTTAVVPETTIPPAPPVTAPAPGTRDDLAIASALAPLQLPSDCGLPFGVKESLPNGARDYRGGVHEGIDFICGERGRNAVAALDGQVLMANEAFVDPTNAERQEILDIAKATGDTPPWTLAMLFGRVVVIDHGNRPGVGHVVTIYAHLEKIDPAIRPGLHVSKGQRLGEIGNTGTETGATKGTRPQSLHLHWEIHVDDEFLARGLPLDATDDVYRKLFGK